MRTGLHTARKITANREEKLQQRLQSSILDRRRIASAQAGMGPKELTTTGSTSSTPTTPAETPGAESSTVQGKEPMGALTPEQVRNHLRDHLQRRGSWVERRIARLQAEVK
jgi:hypothetical protein